MIPREDQERLRTLVIETVTLLCKSGLQYKSEFSIDGLLGITLDHEDVFLVSFKETIKNALSGTDESTSVDSGYTKSSHRKRKLSREHNMFDNQDSDDCTMSVESHADSYEDSDSSISLYKNSSSMLLAKRPTLTLLPGPLDNSIVNHSPDISDDHHSDNLNEPQCKQENVIVIKEESLSDEEYFAAQDLNIGHDVTVTSELTESQINPHTWEPYKDTLIKTEPPEEQPIINDSLQTMPPCKIEPMLVVATKDQPKSANGTGNTGSQKSQRKSSKSSSTTSEPPGPTGSEFFSMFAAQYADLDSEHHDDIARLILFYPGPYVPVRNVRRKYPRYSTDFYVSSMIQMTVPKDAQTYIGELRFLPSRVKVFYKCPPKLVQVAALLKYGFTLESYTETFHKTGGASKEEESPAYHRAIMEYSPYEEFPQVQQATTTDASQLT